ncbi:MAG: hypothetical protein WD512_07430 [Candidatus Paceibacterota bacterium]
MLDETTSKIINNFLLQCGIKFENFDDLEGMIIPREILLLETTYLKVKPIIGDLKKIFSSSSHTSMQNVACTKQRWPLINLVRQVLKSCNYALLPKRISDGYQEDGQKKFKRIFIINKLNKNNEKPNENIEEDQ